MENIKNNFAFMSGILIFSAVFIVLIGIFLKFLFDRNEKFIIKLGKMLSPLFKKRYSIIFLELIYILAAASLVVILYLIRKGIPAGFALIFTYPVFLYVSTVVLFEIRNSHKDAPSLLALTQNPRQNTAKRSFLLNQLKLFFESLTDKETIILFPTMSLMYSLFLVFNWPDEAYFFLLIILPIFLGLWVYFGVDKKQNGETSFLNSRTTINFRRVVLYIALLCIAFKCSYNSYLISLNIKTDYDIKFSTIFLNTYSAIFIACDRLLKAWTDNYRAFRNKALKNKTSA